MAGSWAGKGAAGRIERLFYGGSWRLVRWRCSVQLRGRLAALREVAPCLNARRVEALRWQLLPRVQALRLNRTLVLLTFELDRAILKSREIPDTNNYRIGEYHEPQA